MQNLAFLVEDELEVLHAVKEKLEEIRTMYIKEKASNNINETLDVKKMLGGNSR